MTQEQLNTLSELLADFKSEYTDIDNDGYWNVEEVEGLVDSAISDNNTKETKDILSGKYGATVKPFNEEVVKKVLGENPEVITCRPADLIPDELDTLRGEMAQWSEQEEDVLSYALFPQVATDFFKYREAQKTRVDQTVADTENGSYPV